jgi:hypothetical protein
VAVVVRADKLAAAPDGILTKPRNGGGEGDFSLQQAGTRRLTNALTVATVLYGTVMRSEAVNSVSERVRAASYWRRMGQLGGAGRRRGVSWKKRRVPDLYAGWAVLVTSYQIASEGPFASERPLGMRDYLVGNDGSTHAT